MQLVAELLGTYLSMFAGFAAMVINKKIMMVMIYTVGPVFGAHFNPAVTVAFASCKRVAWRNASASIYVSTSRGSNSSNCHSEINVQGRATSVSENNSSWLRFVVSWIRIHDHFLPHVGELNGHVIGAVITINSILAGPISGGSINPTRSLGPAILSNCYKKQWIYILGPTAGATTGIWFYNAMKSVKSYNEVTKFLPFLRRLAQNKV
ncbi:aquaporin NIP1-1-like [Solanum lycopersicum]|uniref:aquaporin NIP1-1-like n=1 Tax=Solanum lycopersicum TaxID=4081 RepID=UPI0008FEB8A0|nr:aquaporin NIP1-1-like [Solanum lycopersicum]